MPYAGGSGQAATDLIAGRISMIFSPASTIAPHIAAGTVKALAAATAKRAGLFPDLPTIAEAGLPGFDSGIWGGLMAPAGTPRPVIDRLARAADDALKTPEVQFGVAQCRDRSAWRNARGFRALIQGEIEKWPKSQSRRAEQIASSNNDAAAQHAEQQENTQPASSNAEWTPAHSPACPCRRVCYHRGPTENQGGSPC